MAANKLQCRLPPPLTTLTTRGSNHCECLLEDTWRIIQFQAKYMQFLLGPSRSIAAGERTDQTRPEIYK